jgi:hypothetical protein
MLVYAATIFTGAFLLFQVEPLLARYILPWFGGTSAVWITCMLFFQLLLVVGYTYSHLIATRLNPRMQAIVHIAIVTACVLLMGALALIWQSPITPGANWKPLNPDFPISRIFILLIVSIGMPFFILSTTGPAPAIVVRSIAPRYVAISIVRAIERRLAVGTGDLSFPGGTGADAESAGDPVVVAIRRVRGRRRPMRTQSDKIRGLECTFLRRWNCKRIAISANSYGLLALDRAGGGCVGNAAFDHQPDLPRGRSRSLFVGPSARDLPPLVHH